MYVYMWCVYIHVYTHVYVAVYIAVCVCLCVYTGVCGVCCGVCVCVCVRGAARILEQRQKTVGLRWFNYRMRRELGPMGS